MPSANVSVRLEATHFRLDFRPAELIAAKIKYLAIDVVAKRSRPTKFRIQPVKLCR
jgi:hypothetical protein